MATKVSTAEKARTSCTGYELKEMFSASMRWLEKNAAMLNALNVFPVPDGDTGTNMLLTMRSTMEEAARIQKDSACEIGQAMARGALMGARGNSGVILSQILKGLADGIGDCSTFGPSEMCNAFDKASQAAYKAVSKPREGTMLTVTKDVARAARESLAAGCSSPVDMMEAVVREAERSVERTPELLAVLKEAGVVDAGGRGVQVLLEGALHYLRGDAEAMEVSETQFPTARQPAFVQAKSQMTKEKDKEKVYGYCTEFIIKGADLNPDWVRKTVEGKGDSVVVVGDGTMVKVHVHTPHPGAVLEFGTAWGSLHALKIENMDDQHEEFVQMRKAPAVPAASIAIVSVVAGEGLEQIFRSLGATAIVPGGQTMNPSTEEILRAIELVPSDKVIVLPNNKNVVLTAQQAAKISKKRVCVLPTRSVPQGVAALISFNCEVELDSNLSEMGKAVQRVKCIEVTKAVRTTKVGALNIQKGEFIGIVDGKITTACNNLWRAVTDTLDTANLENAEIVTLYYGADVAGEEAQSLGKAVQEQRPGVQVDVVAGGQPHYSYIVSVE